MTVSEGDIIRDEAERSNLQRTIVDLETAIAVSNPGTRRILELSLAGTKVRVSALDKKIEEAKVERAAEVQAQAAAAAKLAARETALSASERETYRGFLEKEYLTKKDFGKLDKFYAQGYDRLSEGGKDEMSKRIHEGIKRGEFKFSDLSQTIQEKDNAHCSAKVTKEAPAQKHSCQREQNSYPPAQQAEITAVRNSNLEAIDLSGVNLAESAGSPYAPNLPDISGSKVTQR